MSRDDANVLDYIGRASDPPPRDPLQFIEPPELRDFLAEEYPEQKQVIGPVNSGFVTLCAGGPGVGKTNLSTAISYSLVSRCNLATWAVPENCPVLYVDGEMSGRQLQDRLALYDFPEDREPLRIVNAISWGAQRGMPHPNFAEKQWQDTLCKWAPDGSVVILDNVMSLVNVPGVSFSSDEFWRSVNPLNLALRAKGCAVIWFDHTNADGRPFGTRTKEWHADLVFTLEMNEKTPLYEDRPGCAFTLSFKKVRGAKGPEHRDIDLEMTVNERGKAVWRSELRKVAEQEWAAELQASGLRQRQIAAEMGISVGKVNKLLKGRIDRAVKEGI